MFVDKMHLMKHDVRIKLMPCGIIQINQDSILYLFVCGENVSDHYWLHVNRVI